MTREEAIVFLDDIMTDCVYGITSDEKESCEMAIEALKKQIPKKIKKQQWMDTKCECGYCFSEDYEDGYYSIPYKNMTKFCPNCGQKLDWNDTE